MCSCSYMQAHRVYLVWLYEKEVVSNPPRVFHWTGYSDRIEIQYLNHVGTLILQHKQISTHQNWDVQYIHICTCKQSLHVVFLYLSRSLSPFISFSLPTVMFVVRTCVNGQDSCMKPIHPFELFHSIRKMFTRENHKKQQHILYWPTFGVV